MRPRSPRSLVVPWRADGGERDRLWEFCRSWWESQPFIDEIIECDSGDEAFCRGRSINRGVEKVSHDGIVIIADADTLVSNIPAACYFVERWGAWVIAHGDFRYYRVSQQMTEAYISGARSLGADPWQWLERGHCYSGCLVMAMEAWRECGGFDERFYGWGPEDVAFAEQMDTMWGPHARVDGFAVQLFHNHNHGHRYGQPSYTENRSLADRYVAARGDPDAMEMLMKEWR